MNARKIFVIVAAALALGGAATVVVAQTSGQTAVMREAKAQGVIGEDATGFLAIRGSATSEVRDAVEAINAARRELYARAASENGVSVAAAGATAFQSQYLPRIPAGQWYRDASGSWVQK